MASGTVLTRTFAKSWLAVIRNTIGGSLGNRGLRACDKVEEGSRDC